MTEANRSGDPAQDELAEILGEFQSLSDVVQRGYQPLGAVAEGSDKTGAVTVTLEGQGTRVTRVVMAADWKKRISPDVLAAAVLEAVVAVQLRPIKDFFADLPATPPPPVKLRVESPPPSPTFGSQTGWDGLGGILETVHKALDAINAGATEGTATAEPQATPNVGRSLNRRVEVSILAGRQPSIVLDEEWAASAGRQQLSDSLTQAFESAYEAVAKVDASAANGTKTDLSADLLAQLGKLGVGFPGQPRKDGNR